MSDRVAAITDPIAGTLVGRASSAGVLIGAIHDGADDTPITVRFFDPSAEGTLELPALAAALSTLLASRESDAARGVATDGGLAVLALGQFSDEDRVWQRIGVVHDDSAGPPSAELSGIGIEATESDLARAAQRLHGLLMVAVDAADAEVRSRESVSGLRRHLSMSFEQLSSLYTLGRTLKDVRQPAAFARTAVEHLGRVFEFSWTGAAFGPDLPVIPALQSELIIDGSIRIESDRFAEMIERVRCEFDEPTPARILRTGEHWFADAVQAELIVSPVDHDGTVVGLIFAGERHGEDPESSTFEMQLIDAVSDMMGSFHQNASRYQQQAQLLTGTVRALSAAIDAKDPYTRGHSERVGTLTRSIVDAMGWSETRSELAFLAGLLHDVGKIGVPEAVLRKPGRLTDDEFDEIKRHPVIGYEILRDIIPLHAALPGVLHHHERMDGAGYPHGLVGEDIPLLARVIAVADGFDAMSSDRSYRARMSREKVLGILRSERGIQWDAEIVNTFLALDLTAYDAMIDRHRGPQSLAA